ncbi:MAG TPA: hypothetical protein VII98_03105 [Solirubrobacteraceae bacterium]
MFPRLETRDDRAPRSRQPSSTRSAAPAQAAVAAARPGLRLRRAADLLLAFVSLDALGLPNGARDDLPVHPHRRPAGVDLPARRAGMPPRPDQVCVTPQLRARRLRDGTGAR